MWRGVIGGQEWQKCLPLIGFSPLEIFYLFWSGLPEMGILAFIRRLEVWFLAGNQLYKLYVTGTGDEAGANKTSESLNSDKSWEPGNLMSECLKE